MDIYNELRRKIFHKFPYNFCVFGDEYYNDTIFDLLASSQNNNKKGLSHKDRFLDIISDPNNLFIKRKNNAGKCKNGIVHMHNGILINDNSYYGDFSEIFKLNLGVHEPSEERAFQYVLEKMPPNAIMIELGSYWCFYSIWFLSNVKKAKVFSVEPEDSYLLAGEKNFKLNNLQGNLIKGFVSHTGFNLVDFVANRNIKYIDLLHLDIQGYELFLLNQINDLLSQRKINYLFISTHGNDLHLNCMQFLLQKGYRIICNCDFDNETFQFDGFILACPNENSDIKQFQIGNRSKSHIISHLPTIQDLKIL